MVHLARPSQMGPMLPQDPQSVSGERVQDLWVYRGSKWRPRGVAALIGAFTWAITQLLHFLLNPVVDRDLILRRMPADLLAGLLVGLLVYRVLVQAYQSRVAILARLEMIARLNHHIRNALHVISLSAYTTQNKRAIDTISESVERINRALREVLPGQSTKAA
jgi:signal transduction histidine kinase